MGIGIPVQLSPRADCLTQAPVLQNSKSASLLIALLPLTTVHLYACAEI